MSRFEKHCTDCDRARSCPASLTVRLSSAVLLALAATGSLAQQRTDQPSAESGSFDEIVVTAQKREQAYLDVPVSVTAITEAEMERENIDSIADYATRVPGLTFDQVDVIGYRGAETLTLRGVTGRSNYYIDDAPIPITDVRLFDITRVEILRGPQGSLYGDAAMGGTVKVVTNKPSTAGFESGFSMGYSATRHGGDSYSTEAFANVPLSDRTALRVTGYYEDIGGFIDNVPPAPGLGDQSGGFLPFRSNVQEDINGGTRKGVRTALRFDASDTVTIDVSAWLQETDLLGRGLYNEPTPLESDFFGKNFSAQDFKYYNATLTWDAGNFTVISSSSYYDIETINTEDLTAFLGRALGLDGGIFGNALQLNNAFPADAFSHETRISLVGSIGEMPVHAVAGLFYQDGESSRDQFFFDAGSIDDINATGAFPFDFGLLFDLQGIERGLWAMQTIPRQQEQIAVFGEISLQPFPALEIIGGFRYFEYDLVQTRTVDGFLFDGFETDSGTTKDSGINPRLGIKIGINDDFIIYANASEGFNIGSALGSALPSVCDPVLEQFGLSDGPIDPETLRSYELGLKGKFLGGKLVFDSALYDIDWQDIQESVLLDPATCPESLSGNFGDASIQGAELAVAVRPNERFRVDATIGYSDVDRTREAVGANAAELIGNTLLTTSLRTEYSWPVRGNLTAYVGGDIQYIEEGKQDEPGTPHYEVANLRIGIADEDAWDVSLIGRNIGDERPPLVRIASGTAGTLEPQIATLRPRSIGVEVRARF